MRKKVVLFSLLLLFLITTGAYAMKKFDYGNPCASEYASCTTTVKTIPNGCGEYNAIQWTCHCINYATGGEYTSTGWACVIP